MQESSPLNLPQSRGGVSIRIAIASGKGGTGKTLVATNLAAAIEESLLVDLDVEEPNCHIFAHASSESGDAAYRLVPKVDPSRCSLCGRCAEVCEFHAIVALPRNMMVFEELCHGCGACITLCPDGAIDEKKHLMGTIVTCKGGRTDLVYGRIRVGEAAATPLIKMVKKSISEDGTVIMDCPPGTACTAVESIKGADICVLVTEPTPFGLHDLELALAVTRKLGVPAAVFINKDGLPGPDIEGFCKDQDVPIVGRLPIDRDIAEIYSKGELIIDATEFAEIFAQLKRRLLEGGVR